MTRNVPGRNASGIQLDFGSYTSDLDSYRGNRAAIQVLRSDAPVGCCRSTRDVCADNADNEVGTVC